ncbi:hypothetical protein GCM10010094_90720 [Streptomyces flaveus]|uniref:Uncharacterized protein n=1 Tax=Streptomyces flaveus TaxID=66370 RepID=A0A917VT13_9ACTN|nr:hypothetical protein GCM10010094_90720 [Streptomyces flaveus]
MVHPQGHRFGSDVSAGPDGAVIRAGMPAAKIAEVSLTSADWVRDVIHDFSADGFS